MNHAYLSFLMGKGKFSVIIVHYHWKENLEHLIEFSFYYLITMEASLGATSTHLGG